MQTRRRRFRKMQNTRLLALDSSFYPRGSEILPHRAGLVGCSRHSGRSVTVSAVRQPTSATAQRDNLHRNDKSHARRPLSQRPESSRDHPRRRPAQVVAGQVEPRRCHARPRRRRHAQMALSRPSAPQTRRLKPWPARESRSEAPARASAGRPQSNRQSLPQCQRAIPPA